MAKQTLASGDRDFEAGDLDNAIKYYRSALDSFRENGHKDLEGISLLRLSYALEQRSEITMARKVANQAAEIFELIGDRVLLKDAKNRVGSLEDKIAQKDRTVEIKEGSIERN